ncbi:hypothetical protein HDA40_005947 [Hamadaea flava]|uniref:DUF202 domain-containing protein n=1 Tax=Hamadaea flava TaxID=1742688 RepID=A0ABV8LWC5_9ACTN|nr:DUF202 domain-containing protein [Hamadaea flava]MCP2327440.1 hypothetical protein [Hamadaea flava]
MTAAPVDRGAQAERTRLAWRRTALAVTVVSLLTVRLALHPGITPVRAAALIGACGVWVFFLIVAQRRIWSLARPAESTPDGAPERPPVNAAVRSPALAAVSCLAMALVGIALTVDLWPLPLWR